MPPTAPSLHPVHTNPPDEELYELLTRARTIAIVGLSPDPSRTSHGVGLSMQRFGYRIVPVRPGPGSVLGEPVVASLSELTGPVDIVNVFRASKYVSDIVDECIAAKLPALWLQEGVIDHSAATRATRAGIFTVMDRCIYKTRLAMMSGQHTR